MELKSALSVNAVSSSVCSNRTFMELKFNVGVSPIVGGLLF